jgi:hypothetical protein
LLLRCGSECEDGKREGGAKFRAKRPHFRPPPPRPWDLGPFLGGAMMMTAVVVVELILPLSADPERGDR